MNGRTQRHTDTARRSAPGSSWARALRGPWTVVRVLAAVVVGSAAGTASALARANAAPPLRVAEPEAPRPGA